MTIKKKPATKKKPTKKKPTARVHANPRGAHKTMEHTEHEATQENTQELASTITREKLEEMSHDGLLAVAVALTAECRRLYEVEARHEQLVSDLEQAELAQAELDDDDDGEDVKPWVSEPERWSRGKLPSGKLIASERVGGGAFFEVSQSEWDRIPAR